ncbi:hypothetical protein BKA62DRAFT_828990 [Auriculariales sp. MPI-PUGE-AT-0066]|nr:hypothetical protein BKA62DRAFT_828990 [Auriculariales sp. MPI-PUGE-AT-0066]
MPAKSRQHASARSAHPKPATPIAPAAKTRAVQRRGRARAGSDDEITREALSDGSDDAESDSDSDSEHPAMQAPPTPVSPHRRPKPPAAASWADEPVANDWSQPAVATDWSAEKPADNDWSTDVPKPASDAWGTAWGASANDWSAEPTKDNDNVPVVDFADFNAGRMPLSPPSNTTTPPQEPRDENRTLRQAYMERLNSDPSFVPFVGSFYGHDDRFMDAQFRKMNRWAQRGANFREEELPPAERSTWKHDGYEELSRSDERRQFSPRGRGGVRGRGRGGLRGGFVQHTPPAQFPSAGDESTAASQPEQPTKPVKISKAFKPPPHWKADRGAWFVEKPERTWTKQTDTYLFNEAQPRPRATITESPVRVKLPGENEASVVKVPSHPRGKDLSAPAAVSTPTPEDAPIVIKLRPTASAATTLPVSKPEATSIEREEPASSQICVQMSHPTSLLRTVKYLVHFLDPAFQASAPQPQFAQEMHPQYMLTPPSVPDPKAYGLPPPASGSPMYHSPAVTGTRSPAEWL